MENLNQLEKLVNTSVKLENGIKQYREVYEKDQKHYDKIGFSFNSDNRFAAHKGITLRLDTWKGIYGNSGSSTILSLDDEIFGKHLLKVIRANKWLILEQVSSSIKEEAKQLKDKAVKELEERLNAVNSL